MINNLCSEDFNSFCLCKLHSFRGNSHIKCKNCGKFFLDDVVLVIRGVQNLHCFHNILLMDGSNRDRTHWNLRLKQEFEECFKRTKGRCLDTDTFFTLVDVLVHDVDQVVFNFFNGSLDFVIVLGHKKFGTGNSIFEIWCSNLDTHGTLDLLMMNVFGFNSHFLHWMWGKESSNLSYNCSVETLQNNSVVNLK